jgi:3-oxoacyl-[acyl-carrier protein] reductase
MDVVVAARNLGPAEEVAEQIRSLDRKALALSLDVSDLAAVEEAAKRIEADLGKVSVLVSNAGITRDQLFVRMKPEEWSEVLRVNLDGAYHCMRVFARDMMRARWGRVVTVSSVVGIMGNAGQANYAAAKAGLIGLVRSVARELAPRSVTANVVAPGFIDTAMTRDLPESVKESMLGSIPLGRFGSAEDVAGVVSFLAGDEAAYMTGQVIHVDGGMVMA